MAGRVNTRFVVILALVVAVVTGGVVALWYFTTHRDPTENIARGDAYLAQHQINEAAEEYGKALSKRPHRVDIILKYVDVVSRKKITGTRDAQLAVAQIQHLLDQACTIDPTNPKPFDDLMQFYMQIGTEIGDLSSWNRMLDRSQATLSVVDNFILARKYRGIAQVNRMRTLDLNADEREKAKGDLLAVLKQNPADLDALYHLTLWNFLQAQMLDRAGREPDKVRSYREEARALNAQFLAKSKDDVEATLRGVHMLLNLQNSAQVTPWVDRLETTLTASPQPTNALLELVDILVKTDRQSVPQKNLPATTRGLQRAEKLLQAGLQAHPDDIRLRFALGQCYSQLRLTDQAITEFDKVRQSNIQGVPFVALMSSQLQLFAALQYTDMLLTKLDTLTDHDAREKLLKQVEDMIAKVTPLIGADTPQINLRVGRVALARGKWVEATIKLDRASSQFREANPEAILLSARARLNSGEPGAAAQRLVALLALNPSLLAVRTELVGIQIQLHQYAEAQKNLDLVLAADPADPHVLQLQAALLAQTGQIDRAIAIYRKLDPDKNPQLIPNLANLYIMAGQSSVARKMLSDLFDKDARDLRILQVLLRLAENKEQALHYIDLARQAGADKRMLDLLAGSFEKQLDVTEAIEKLIGQEPDPLQRALQRYALYRRMGRTEAADQELAEAIKIAPDNSMVIDARFNRALDRKDWSAAHDLAERATQLNLDMAQGAFYQGQLALAHNQLDLAITNFRTGLLTRAVYSDGWRMLGDAHRLSGDLTDSASAYRRALEQRPNNVAALRGLAGTLDAQGSHGTALDCLRQAYEYTPNDPAMQSQYLSYEEQYGDPQRALTIRRKLEQDHPGDATNRRAIALLEARMGRPDEATQILHDLMAKEGQTVTNMAVLAGIRTLAGDKEGARKMLEDHVHKLGAKASADDWILLAKYYLSLHEDANALAAFKSAITVEDPVSRPATRELADLMFDRGLFAEALSYYQKLYEASTKDMRVGQRYVETLLRAGNVALADTTLKKVIGDFGEDSNTYVLQGLVARARGDAEKARGDNEKAGADDARAVAAIKRAVELAPTRALLHYQLAEQLDAKPDREKAALESLNHALELDSNFLPARLLLARIRIRQHDSSEAIRELQIALKISPAFLPARLLLAQVYQDAGMASDRRVLLEESYKITNDTLWLRLIARQLQQEGNLDEALHRLNDAVNAAPNADNIIAMGQLLIAAKQPENTLALTDKFSTIVDAAPLLRAIRARALVLVKQPAQANADFARAMRECTTFAQVSQINDQVVAALSPKQAVALLQPLTLSSQGTWIELMIAASLVGDEQFQPALDRLQRVDLLLKPDSAERQVADRLSAVALTRLGQYDKAREMYERLLHADPANVTTLNNLAYLLVQNLNRSQDGLQMAAQAVQLAPNDPQVQDTLGWAQFKAGLGAQALRTLRHSVELAPLPPNLYHLAEVQLAAGDRAAAVHNFAEAKRLAEERRDSEILQATNQRLTTLKN